MIRTIEDVTTLKCWKPALYIPGKTAGMRSIRKTYKILILWNYIDEFHTYPFVCNYINIGRCDQDFINKLPMPMSHLRLATGYGCATIFWFLRNCPEYLNQFDCCGTIMDFVVAMITDNHDEKPVMSVHNAASWGYFDTVSNKVSPVYHFNASTLKTLYLEFLFVFF